MVLLTQWTWVWGNSGKWWRTGKPGMLQSVGLQRVRHDWATEQQQNSLNLVFPGGSVVKNLPAMWETRDNIFPSHRQSSTLWTQLHAFISKVNQRDFSWVQIQLGMFSYVHSNHAVSLLGIFFFHNFIYLLATLGLIALCRLSRVSIRGLLIVVASLVEKLQ